MGYELHRCLNHGLYKFLSERNSIDDLAYLMASDQNPAEDTGNRQALEENKYKECAN